jgi:hypothetical protein
VGLCRHGRLGTVKMSQEPDGMHNDERGRELDRQLDRPPKSGLTVLGPVDPDDHPLNRHRPPLINKI